MGVQYGASKETTIKEEDTRIGQPPFDNDRCLATDRA